MNTTTNTQNATTNNNKGEVNVDSIVDSMNDYVRIAQEGGLRIEDIERNGNDIVITASYFYPTNDLIDQQFLGFAKVGMSQEEIIEMAKGTAETFDAEYTEISHRERIEESILFGSLSEQLPGIDGIEWEIEDSTDYEGVLEWYLRELEEDEVA